MLSVENGSQSTFQLPRVTFFRVVFNQMSSNWKLWIHLRAFVCLQSFFESSGFVCFLYTSFYRYSSPKIKFFFRSYFFLAIATISMLLLVDPVFSHQLFLSTTNLSRAGLFGSMRPVTLKLFRSVVQM